MLNNSLQNQKILASSILLVSRYDWAVDFWKFHDKYNIKIFKRLTLRLYLFNTILIKELSLCHKLKFSNPYIYGTWCCRLLIFQTKIILCNRIHSLKYLRSTTLGCRDIRIRKSEFVSKTQFLWVLKMEEN